MIISEFNRKMRQPKSIMEESCYSILQSIAGECGIMDERKQGYRATYIMTNFKNYLTGIGCIKKEGQLLKVLDEEKLRKEAKSILQDIISNSRNISKRKHKKDNEEIKIEEDPRQTPLTYFFTDDRKICSMFYIERASSSRYSTIKRFSDELGDRIKVEHNGIKRTGYDTKRANNLIKKLKDGTL